MPNKKDIERLVSEAQKWAGWRVERTKAGYMFYPPDKALSPIAVHLTHSDHRGWQNMLSRLRRAGAPV